MLSPNGDAPETIFIIILEAATVYLYSNNSPNFIAY